jgi:transposase-like protein
LYTPALEYMEVVAQRDATTLLPIIQAHVLPNSTIYSDEWRAYNRAITLPNVAMHRTVMNHSFHFRDPATGVHTNHVESYWNRVKLRLKRMKGCHRHMLPSYLDEFMWRERYGKTRLDAFQNMMADIADCYPVPH